ncbi:hypothetical protein HK104_009813 [Borealophlyctis nickersoniae]|nr:hypothetical protein HK104_009813 [Borealophlyctis nickersoniae]
MDDAATIISTCSRLLSNPHTVTETDARAAVAACEAWLKEHYPQLQTAVVSRRARHRLPPEILNKIFRLLPYEEKAVLLACSSVNREWRRHGWPHVWKKFRVCRKSLAIPEGQFTHPLALEATKGIHVRHLVVARTQDSLDYLPSLLAAPIFTGLRCLCLSRTDASPPHLLVAFRSLPNLTYLKALRLDYGQVAWGSNLGLTGQEENETWRIGFGNLKALCMSVDAEGIMLEKLALGLGSKLESLRIRSFARGMERRLDQFSSTVSQICPNLVDFELVDYQTGWYSIQRFITTHQQLVSLSLSLGVNASDNMIRTIAAACVNLKIFRVAAAENVTSRSFQHLASGPFLQGLDFVDFTAHPKAEGGIVEFLRHRGRDLEYLRLPNNSGRALAPFIDFLPNIRHLDPGTYACRDNKQDVIAFLNGAKKLKRLWMGCPDNIPHLIYQVAIPRKVEFCDGHFELPDYVELEMESWMGM